MTDLPISQVPCAAPNLLAGWSRCLLPSREDFGLLLLMFYRACWKAPPGELQPFAEVVEPCVGGLRIPMVQLLYVVCAP